MGRIIFNVAAKCDKAGRSQNQDNFLVCPDLDHISTVDSIGNDRDIELSRKGALFVVADGMGGMKSGEKASEFIIDGIKRKFAAIPDDILNNGEAIISFIKHAIAEADNDIKQYAANHRESEGMGSTVALVWLLGEKAYCGWCGDSRIYCYNPQNSLVRLSHDHSYVQSLVDEGKITDEEAFEHPDGNIITRSLGDNGEAADPETKIYPIHRRDVFLLCSDGLCGLIPDSELEGILADNCTSSSDALKSLWRAGEKEGWSDNATIEVACISEGGSVPTRKGNGYDEGRPKAVNANKDISKGKDREIGKNTEVMPGFKKKYMGIISCVLVAAVAIGGYVWFTSGNKNNGNINSSKQEFTVDPADYPEQQEKRSEKLESPTQNLSNNGKNEPEKKETGKVPSVINRPGVSTSGSGNVPAPDQTVKPDSPQKVSGDYLNVLNTTYGTCKNVRNIITKGRRPFTGSDAQTLAAFQANAKMLNKNKPSSGLSSEDQKKLNEIVALNSQVNKVLSSSGSNPHHPNFNIDDLHEKPEPDKNKVEEQEQPKPGLTDI